MKLYNFSKLINKYSATFRLVKEASGHFDKGKWIEDESQEVEMRGAIVPLSDRKIYGSGGTYTSQDRELYLSQPLKGSLSDFKVVYKGNSYAIEDSRDFEDYADVAVYTLKRVSAGA